MSTSLSIEFITWIGIFFCISQSAVFSGLNLALFSISRLRLEVEADLGNRDASKILTLRKDSNFLLTTILWGNVGINVLLTLLSNSVLAGVSAFFFSTVIITIIGEIMPQAYFSHHALRMASLLAPVLKFYQILLFPAAKPTAKLLDAWLGAEGIQYLREHSLREVIKKHIDADVSDVDRLEGIGALNFLAIDDMLVVDEGEHIDPDSMISLEFHQGLPVFPAFERTTSDPFLRQVEISLGRLLKGI
jgi:metal transporter CNNM